MTGFLLRLWHKRFSTNLFFAYGLIFHLYTRTVICLHLFTLNWFHYIFFVQHNFSMSLFGHLYFFVLFCLRLSCDKSTLLAHVNEIEFYSHENFQKYALGIRGALFHLHTWIFRLAWCISISFCMAHQVWLQGCSKIDSTWSFLRKYSWVIRATGRPLTVLWICMDDTQWWSWHSANSSFDHLSVSWLVGTNILFL